MRSLRSIVLASLLVLCAAMPAMRVSAQAPGGAEEEGYDARKFIDYAACAISIGFASGTGAWLLAGFVCYRAFADHWDR